MTAPTQRALVLFSGGQDSTTCLAWALQHFDYVETIGFNYGQRHAVELSMRPQLLAKMRQQSAVWESRLGEDHLLDLSLISQLSRTAMTEDIAIEMQANGLPNTFVPGRNLMFMLTAATLAYRRQLGVSVGGTCAANVLENIAQIDNIFPAEALEKFYYNSLCPCIIAADKNSMISVCNRCRVHHHIRPHSVE